MSFSYFTISKPVEEISFKEKGSKFIGFVYPISNLEEVKEYLNQIREKFPDATHHCYAYKLGIDDQIYRVNDDGEPNGSAGLPIYNQILSKGITNVLVVVVRYYGGTKLGVSGLVKAYKSITKTVLDAANIVEKHLTTQIQLFFSYSEQGNVMRVVDKWQAKVLSTNFEESCKLVIEIPLEFQSGFLSSVENLPEITLSILN